MDENQQLAHNQSEGPSLVDGIFQVAERCQSLIGEDEPVYEYLAMVLQSNNIQEILIGAVLACHVMTKIQCIQGSATNDH